VNHEWYRSTDTELRCYHCRARRDDDGSRHP